MAEVKLVGLPLARALRKAKTMSATEGKKFMEKWKAENLEAVKKKVLADLKKRASKK